MANVLGEVVIRSNGKQLKTKKGSTLNPGGFNYTDHMGAWSLLGGFSRVRYANDSGRYCGGGRCGCAGNQCHSQRNPDVGR